MAKFITTIQLQDATEYDYEILDRELKKDSFKVEKKSGRSAAYISDKAVFTREGNVSIMDINNAIFRAVSKTGKKYSFFTIRNKQIINAN